MTKVQKEQVKITIPTYCKAKGISCSDLAVKVGVSAATISNMKNGKWESIDNKLWKRVWNEINPEIVDGMIQTVDSTLIIELCEKAQEQKFMVGLTGDTGMGKTTGCKAFAIRPEVFYYYVDGTVAPKVFLESLLRDMGIGYYGTTNSMLTLVADELNTLNNPLLIVDECGKLSEKMILTLHSLRDKTMANCGIVLAGMPAFKNNLIKQVNKGTPGYAEFFRRINIWDQLRGLSANEITYVLESNGITDKDAQRDFRKLNRFGDLMNEITLYKLVNN